MKPFTRPRSDSRNKSTASASTETSCSELKILCPKTSQPINVRFKDGSGTNAIVTIVRVMPNCAARIQGRLRPMAGIPQRSMIGPHTHLKVQGRVDIAVTVPIAATVSPFSER